MIALWLFFLFFNVFYYFFEKGDILLAKLIRNIYNQGSSVKPCYIDMASADVQSTFKS